MSTERTFLPLSPDSFTLNHVENLCRYSMAFPNV